MILFKRKTHQMYSIEASNTLREISRLQVVGKEVITWIHRCNTRRPYSALDYRSPAEYRAHQLTKVA